jgi:hypothetical protein
VGLGRPIHFVIGRDGAESSQTLFVSDLRPRAGSDLSRYQGSPPAPDLLARGWRSRCGTIKWTRA